MLKLNGLFASKKQIAGLDIGASSIKIAETLKTWIEKGEFLLGEPQALLPSVSPTPPQGRRKR